MCSILSIDATFSTLLKGIIRKECQSFTNHGHDKTPPTVFNPLSLWLTLPLNMGVSHTLWPPSIARAILACLWFAQGFTGYKKSKQQSHSCVPVVCTGLAQGSKKSKQQSHSMMFRVILCMSPLEKVPFATFYPSWRYLCGTYFSKKRLLQVDSCIQFYRSMQLVFFNIT